MICFKRKIVKVSENFSGIDQFDVWILEQDNLSSGGTVRTSFAQPLSMVLCDHGAGLISPCFTLTRDDAQGLMETLWNAGLRPRESFASKGQTEAMKEHLNDLRKIIFEKRGGK